jgi:hypothetical protein
MLPHETQSYKFIYEWETWGGLFARRRVSILHSTRVLAHCGTRICMQGVSFHSLLWKSISIIIDFVDVIQRPFLFKTFAIKPEQYTHYTHGSVPVSGTIRCVRCFLTNTDITKTAISSAYTFQVRHASFVFMIIYFNDISYFPNHLSILLH